MYSPHPSCALGTAGRCGEGASGLKGARTPELARPGKWHILCRQGEDERGQGRELALRPLMRAVCDVGRGEINKGSISAPAPLSPGIAGGLGMGGHGSWALGCPVESCGQQHRTRSPEMALRTLGSGLSEISGQDHPHGSREQGAESLRFLAQVL